MNSTWFDTQLIKLGLPESLVNVTSFLLISFLVILIAVISTKIVRRVLQKSIIAWIRNNRYSWDDPLVNTNLFLKISWFIPLLIVSLAVDIFPLPHESLSIFVKRSIMTGFVIVAMMSLTALLTAINDIYQLIKKQRGHLLQGYFDGGKIVVYILGVIFIIAIVTGKSPWGILTVLGGLTAVTMLIFKDSILGFVASIQLTATDMIRIGDWIEMDQFGADGEVVKLSIHSVRVRNWDKTITTIPTYNLVSSSFKNWRGMSESGGRRIKRSLFIDISSIRFCDQAMLDRFSKIELLRDYLQERRKDIERYNATHNIDTSEIVNGRRQTNIGVFRAYVSAYLQNNPKIHKDMTFLVRQLPITEHGLPLEIYIFSNDQVWAHYESIQADIFDHLIAAAPEFGLRLFQNPSGSDIRRLIDRESGSTVTKE